jgi:hypothetical protein
LKSFPNSLTIGVSRIGFDSGIIWDNEKTFVHFEDKLNKGAYQ